LSVRPFGDYLLAFCTMPTGKKSQSVSGVSVIPSRLRHKSFPGKPRLC